MAEHDADREDRENRDERDGRDAREGREPEEQSVPFDEAAAWAAIVAGYGDEPPDPPFTSRASEPSALRFFLGTTKSDTPLMPAGAPSMRASTRCTMFSVRSCSPPEMKILVPVIL